MKIGVITFWQTRDNYGQILQCYALQQVLKKMGHDPFLIRYLHSEHKNPLIDKLKYGISNFIHLRWNNLFLKRNQLPPIGENDKKREFESFKKSHILKSQKIYDSLKSLKNNPPSADCYVVGSDQVWSKSIASKENRVFFLDFGSSKIKRVSYAASFSMDIYPPKHLMALRKALEGFDRVSVREKTGVQICKSVGITAELVLDPTILLKACDYESLLKLKHSSKKQIYIYSVNISSPEEIKWTEIEWLSQSLDLDLVVTPSSGYIPCMELYGEKAKYEYCKIPEWIENIADSQIVITTSFHGVVFCLLFHTQFVYVPLSGLYARGNNRVLELMDIIGLREVVLKDGSSIQDCVAHEINWNEIDKRLDSVRETSLIFLKNSLGENGGKKD